MLTSDEEEQTRLLELLSDGVRSLAHALLETVDFDMVYFLRCLRLVEPTHPVAREFIPGIIHVKEIEDIDEACEIWRGASVEAAKRQRSARKRGRAEEEEGGLFL